jgi:hypothetical protein
MRRLSDASLLGVFFGAITIDQSASARHASTAAATSRAPTAASRVTCRSSSCFMPRAIAVDEADGDFSIFPSARASIFRDVRRRTSSGAISGHWSFVEAMALRRHAETNPHFWRL